MQSALIVIARQTFRDEEYLRPREALESAGISVTTASTAAGPCFGKLGMVAVADVSMAEVSGRAFDAVIFVGGGGAATLFDDSDAHRLAREVAESGGTVAAICIAPSILARAGLLVGRRATAFPSQRDDLIARDATFVDEPVVQDGNYITANGPDAASEFGRSVSDAILAGVREPT